MAEQPALLTSGGTQFQIKTLAFGQTVPPEVTITVTAAADVDATALTVTIVPTTNVTLYEGLVLIVGTGAAQQLVIVSATAQGSATTLTVEPLKKAIAANTVIKTFAGIPLIGLEAANMNLTTETNQAVLLSNNGWRVTDYSTGSFEFSGNLYIPTSVAMAVGARAVSDALLQKRNVYVERFLPDGTYHAGMCCVTSASDQTTGAQYITQNVTFTGSGKPVQRLLQVA